MSKPKLTLNQLLAISKSKDSFRNGVLILEERINWIKFNTYTKGKENYIVCDSEIVYKVGKHTANSLVKKGYAIYMPVSIIETSGERTS